jgi:8-oxo-dGTP diphosphatase
VVREVGEETGLSTEVETLVGVYSASDRDPRGRSVSVAYVLRVVGGDLRAGDDAADVLLVPLDQVPTLGFDHSLMVKDFLGLRSEGSPGGR